MVSFNIYNYANAPTVVECEEEIKSIYVNVITGDESIIVEYETGQKECFDSCNFRNMDFFDGCYILTEPEEINAWMNFDISEIDKTETISYARQYKFASFFI